MPRVCVECQEEDDADFCPNCGGETDELIECAECGFMNHELNANCYECEADL